MTRKISYHDYDPGHPWYYKLGGRVLYPKQIRDDVKAGGYRGYKADDLDRLDQKREPERSSALRAQRDLVLKELRLDLYRYRKCARELHTRRKNGTDGFNDMPACADVHTSMSLKHNHIVNDFAHLLVIEDYLSQQPDLFGF